jgi:Uma2 family endonuclease
MNSATRTLDDGIDEFETVRSHRGGPTWEIARHFPNQGDWTEQDFLALTDRRHIEFNDGCLEFLPMPTKTHQELLGYLYVALLAFVKERKLGKVFTSGYRIKLREGQIREPDVLFAANGRPLTEQFAAGADLVIEIMSPGTKNRERDLDEKRAEYAAAGIPEYWIVDPEQQSIKILALDGAAYRVHGEFKPGGTATSVLLPGFAVDVRECFAASTE